MSPFLTPAQAAKYVAYTRQHFGRLVKEYKIPRYGPELTRYRQSDLDAWMENPYIFVSPSSTGSARRRSTFTPVKA